uniref:BTB domain-containing protein n=1 Tax=Panagrolaimus sp. PS1159 TaxID=55785 RepID=A0AC35GTS8_9BILA
MSSLKRKFRETKTIKCPFAINWIIQKSLIENITEHDEFLVTPIFDASNIPGIGYQIRLHPARVLPGEPQTMTFYFLVSVGNEKEVYGNYTVEIKSANFSETHTLNYQSTDTQSFGKRIAPRNELFNPENRFFVDETLFLQFSGVLKVFRPDGCYNCKKQRAQSLGDLFWFNGDQDFKILVGDNMEILAHKSILSLRSEVFRRMFQSPFLETIESKIAISDFYFETVHAAIHLCYDREIEHIFDVSLGVELLRFFDKYLMDDLKKLVEYRLIPEINVINVCQLSLFALNFNAFELENECLKFLGKCSKEGIMISDLDIFHKDLEELDFDISRFCYFS